jgi:GLPGLI family protein
MVVRIFGAALASLLAFTNLTAQESLSGTIAYQQIVHYNFDNIKQAHGNDERTQDWLSTLPDEGVSTQMLKFNSRAALFEEDDSEKEAKPAGLQRALMYENSLKPVQAKVQKVYYDFDKKQKLEQVEFLTRIFLVESEIESIPWKLGSDKKKVLEYVCLGATATIDDQEIMAWFAPEIPVSLGPSIFSGLPGMILAVERNGETAYVATSVILNPPVEPSIVKPNKGSKVGREEFVSIRKEKEKERKENTQDTEMYHR